MKLLVVCRRELRSYFSSYIAYVLLAIFLLLSGYFFYSDLIFFVLFGGYVLPTGLWQYVFLDMRLCTLLVLPLYLPVLIFATGAVEASLAAGGARAHLLLLGALTLAALPLAPLATAAALRQALD